ncbi:MAG: hypothetical protein QOF63_3516 [Thermoanaerobaculia bacterium]|jgi:hypothetical protein|nr:hypothetical protein [Thermoanaerobaculia bacterium]
MPSLGDIANDIETRLDDIKNNTQGIVNQLNQLNGEVNQLNNTDQLGFANLAQGLSVLVQLQQQANDLLASNDKQNQTIICWLANIAHVLCDIKRDTDQEILLQKKLVKTSEHVDDMLTLVHSREAVEVDNQHELEDRIGKCCPEKETEPKPCFSECAAPGLPDYHPVKVDWTPIRFPRPAANPPQSS